jgi:glycosyltransferase involved in cell wall biosynthesis
MPPSSNQHVRSFSLPEEEVLHVAEIRPPDRGSLDVAFVHDWLPVYAGAERVLEQMLAVLPGANLYSLIDHLPPDQRDFLGGRHVNTSFIQNLPFSRTRYRYYLPFAPLAIEQFDLTGHDVVVSSSYVVAKGVLTQADQLHVSYVHSPVRYAWDLQFQYLKQGGVERGVRSAAARMILHYLRLFDAASASRVDVYVANSRNVARRIWKTYRRKPRVIYPPVDVDRFSYTETKEDYYVTISRLVPYKRIDLIVDAFSKMPDKELIVIGDGPEMDRLVAKGVPNVTLLGYQPFDAMRHYLERAKAFIFAAEEDFGIAPVEAQACGTPVIAYGKGGATETVIPGETGLFFHEQTEEALRDAVQRFELARPYLNGERMVSNAGRFSAERFREEFGSLIEEEYESFVNESWR